MQSYREWHLHVLNDENGKLFFKIVGPEPRMKNIEQYEDPIHVIEKSAYDTIQAELDEARAEIKRKKEYIDILSKGWPAADILKLKSRLERAESLLRDAMVSMTLTWPLEAEKIKKYFAENK